MSNRGWAVQGKPSGQADKSSFQGDATTKKVLTGKKRETAFFRPVGSSGGVPGTHKSFLKDGGSFFQPHPSGLPQKPWPVVLSLEANFCAFLDSGTQPL